MHRRLQSRRQMEMQTFFEADRCPMTSYDDVMANPAQLAGQIRYYLGELSTRNGHHEFEELARHTARARLYSNILPATGPVSSGGDGGRDFETFETQISDRLTVGSSFAGRSSTTRRVAFACSLEKKIEAKIRRDLKTIIANGKPDEIIYFCEGNLPIGRRRKLIKEAEAADVELRVFDGTAIAEWLAEPDIFWIAQQYLHLPADLAPDVAQEEGYSAHRQKWAERDVIPVSRAHFVAIKSGLRAATFEESARVDLGFWLSKMECFFSAITPRDLVRDASYEIAVAQLRGRGELDSQAARVEDYFSDLEDHVSIGDLSTASTLLAYCMGAHYLGHFRGNNDDFAAIRDRLSAKLQNELTKEIGPGRRAGLFHVSALLERTPPAPGVIPNYGKSAELWKEMLDHAAEAPLYPLESFADLLTKLISNGGNDEGLLELGIRTDELLAKRLGGTAAGEKALDRAYGLIDRGERAAAIRELHRAKGKWFSGERLRGAITILLLLSREYGELGLGYAAKYHAMAAAFVAEGQDVSEYGDLLADAIFDIAGADDLAGNSFAYLRAAPVLSATHLVHADHEDEGDDSERIHINIGQASALLGLLARRDAAGWAQVENITADWPPPLAELVVDGAREQSGFWNNESWDDTWEGMETGFADRPFGDVGEERNLSWEALGLRWKCRFSNDFATTPAAEQLVTELQLIACAFAQRDLGIVPDEVRIEISVGTDADEFEIEEVEAGEASFHVRLPAADRGPDEFVHAVEVFAAALRNVSVLDDDDLMHKFNRDLFEASFIGRPYAELFRHFFAGAGFAEALRRSIPQLDPDREFRSKRFDFVPWYDGPGPNFDPARSLLDIENRYRLTLQSLRFTVPRLMADGRSRELLEAMHLRGMKDWEILSIVGNIMLNARLRGLKVDPQEWSVRGQEMLATPESEADAMDPGLLTAEELRLHEVIYHGVFLANWGLHAPWRPNGAGLERFLVERFRLRDLDVEHTDIFSWDEWAAKSEAL